MHTSGQRMRGKGQPAVQIFTHNYRTRCQSSVPLPTQFPPLQTLFSHPISLPLTTINITGPGAEKKARRTASPGWLGLWTTGKAKEGSLKNSQTPKRKHFPRENWLCDFFKDCGDPVSLLLASRLCKACLRLGGNQLPLRTAKRTKKKKMKFSLKHKADNRCL